jgi:hypothetical protein
MGDRPEGQTRRLPAVLPNTSIEVGRPAGSRREAVLDEQPIWASQVFPSRVEVRVVLASAPEHGVPVLEMRDELTVFRGLDNPNRWQGPFRGSPVKWKASDGEAIIRALEDAKANPGRASARQACQEARQGSPAA